MLNPEQARKELKKFRIKDSVARRVSAVGKLPARLAVAGFALLGRGPDGTPFHKWEQRQEGRTRAGELLDSCAAGEREKVFTALFPRLAKVVGAAWHMLCGLPYQEQDMGPPFRAPHHPAATRSDRVSRLTEWLDALKPYDPGAVD